MTRTKKEVRKEMTELEQEIARLQKHPYKTDAQKAAIKHKKNMLSSLKRVLNESPEKKEYQQHWSEDMDYIRAAKTFRATFKHHQRRP